jgi:POT family proton-dependent oligopeptide transporter
MSKYCVNISQSSTNEIGVQQNPIVDFHTAPLPARGQPTAEFSHQNHSDDKDEKALYDPAGEDVTVTAAQDQLSDDLIPTEEDMLTLRKVPAPMK